MATGGGVAGPRGPGGVRLSRRPAQRREFEAAQVRVGEGERVAVDAVVPGPAGRGGEDLEGFVRVGGTGSPAAAAAVHHRVQRQGGVVRSQLLRGEGGGERSRCLSSSSHE